MSSLSRSPGADKALEVDRVTKHYGGEASGTEALREVSFSVAPGEFAAIVGPSGSGKTTLLNIIGALDRPSSGKVLVSGRDLTSMSNSELARLRNEEIGFVFQTFNLIPRMTALQNIALPLVLRGVDPWEREDRALGLLREFGLEAKSGSRPGEMSGGEQQRVAVARALANDPLIVLADEPTGNLDSKNSEQMLGIFQSLNSESGRTIVMITHNLELARRAGKVVSIKDGRVVGISEN